MLFYSALLAGYAASAFCAKKKKTRAHEKFKEASRVYRAKLFLEPLSPEFYPLIQKQRSDRGADHA